MADARSTLTQERETRIRMPGLINRILAFDPGLNRLLQALQSVVTIGLAMAVEWGFVLLTHAMELPAGGGLPPAQAALVAAQRHGVTVIGIMVGAVIGMIAAFTGGMFPNTRALLTGYLAMPVLMVGGLALGLALAPNRSLSLTTLAIVLAAGAYCRRFGPIGFVGGQMVFMGDFFGFFLASTVGLHDLGWLTAEIFLAAAVALLAQFTLFYPGRRAGLIRLQRSYDARRRDLVAYAIEIVDEPDAERAQRMVPALHRRLGRLNEATLMIDGQLGLPRSIPRGWSAETLHQILFDAELAASNMGRFVGTLAVSPALSVSARSEVRAALAAVYDGRLDDAERHGRRLLDDPEPVDDEVIRVVLNRFGRSVIGHCEAQRRFRVAAQAAASGRAVTPEETFESPVVLMAGWLPGSAMISAAASNQPDAAAVELPWYKRPFLTHVPLAPNVRVAIQMGVAVAGAILLGEVLSGRRFYWAVIAAFVTFMGANNATEQVRKGVNRVIGTLIGAVAGAALAHLVGNHGWWAVAVILAAIFFGIYLMRVSYAFMVIGITVMVSQLYVQLDEFSYSLLLLRLGETALGAAVAALTVLCVLPLRTGRVARLSARAYLDALAQVVGDGVDLIGGGRDDTELRTALRRLDDAHQTLVAVSRALQMPLFDHGGQREHFLAAAAASRHYARNLLIDAPAASGALSPTDLAVAHQRFSESLQAITRWLDTGEIQPYVRSAALFSRVACGTEFGTSPHLALRDLELLDGALATMADAIGLPTRALDTV